MADTLSFVKRCRPCVPNRRTAAFVQSCTGSFISGKAVSEKEFSVALSRRKPYRVFSKSNVTRRNGAVLQMEIEVDKKSTEKGNVIADTEGENPQGPAAPARYAVGALYIGFVTFALFLAPGSWSEPGELSRILSGNLDGTNDLFFAIFNLLGAISVNFAALLNAGSPRQKKLPTELFSFFGLVAGFFFLGPYLAGREYVPSITAEEVHNRGIVSRVLESRLFSFGTVLYSIWAYAFAFGFFSPGTQEFHDVVFYAFWMDLVRLFSSDPGVCVSCIDFVILSATIWGPLTEDMRRRGWFQKGKEVESALSAISFILVPGLGPAVYLSLRSRLPSQGTEVST